MAGVRRGDRRWDDFGAIVCMAYVDGYVMCRRPRYLPGVWTLKEWQALSAYPLKIKHLTPFQRSVLEAMDQGLDTSREITDKLHSKETLVSEAMDYVDAFKRNLTMYTPPKI